MSLSAITTPSFSAPESDPVDRYYADAAQRIEELKNRSLDPSRSPAERTTAAAELSARYPTATQGLWAAWVKDGSAPQLAQLAIDDMAGQLFATDYHPTPKDSTSQANPDAPADARGLLRSLAAHASSREVRRGALDALGSAGDPVGLAALKDAVRDHVYEPSLAFKHLSAAPRVGAPILASFAYDETLPMKIRLGAVRAMTNSTEYSASLRRLALSQNLPSEIRREAIRSQFTFAPVAALDTAVAAIGSEQSRDQKDEFVGVITENVGSLPRNGSTEEALLELSKSLRAEHGSNRVTAARLHGLDQAIADEHARMAEAKAYPP